MSDAPQLRRFVRRADEGVQRPPIFEASDDHQYVLKLDTHERGFPAAELIGACLAEPLGVSVPTFGILTVPEPLVAACRSVGDEDHRDFADSWERLGGQVFGSRYLDGVVHKWRSSLRSRVTGADVFLLRLMVFDAFIENMDRSAEHNPNLLVASGSLFAIDHGQGLPTVHGARSGFSYNYASHIAWPVWLDRPALVDEALQPLLALDAARIDEAVNAVPSAWWPTADLGGATRRALRARQSAVIDEIRGMLERR